MSSSDIIRCGNYCLLSPNTGWALSYTHQQFQTNFGGNEALPEGFVFSYYEKAFGHWESQSISFAIAQQI